MHEKLEKWIDLISRIDKNHVFEPEENKRPNNFITIGDKILMVWENQPDGVSTKYYLLALFSPDGSQETLTLSEIEMEIERNDEVFTEIGRPKASDSYLILLYPVKEITNNVYVQVMEEEEVSVQFKRYVLYYTQEEFEAGINWVLESDTRTLEKSLLEELEQLKDKLIAEFLKRILIKIPFFKLEFTTRELPEFNEILMNKLSKIKNSTERVEALKIEKMLFSEGVTVDDMAAKLLHEIEDEVEKEICID